MADEHVAHTPKTYRCANCDGIFLENCTDEEAMQEFITKFGKGPENEILDVLCDDCYQDFEKWFEGLPEEVRAEMESKRANQNGG